MTKMQRARVRDMVVIAVSIIKRRTN